MPDTATILHPTDFSSHANQAFALACSLARASGSRLLVLHVMPVPLVQAKRGYREEMGAALRLRRVETDRPAVEHRLEEGEAASAVLRVAAEVSAELVVMGTLGRTGLERLLMGSVAEEVVRNAHCPVVTVRASPRETASGPQEPAAVPIRTILHPTDFSEACKEAFRVACSLARDHAAEVVVVHVPEPPAVGSGMAASPPASGWTGDGCGRSGASRSARGRLGWPSTPAGSPGTRRTGRPTLRPS